MADTDNLYPTNGEYFIPFRETVAQKNARLKEKAQVLSAMPQLKAVISRLERQIEFLSSIDSIPEEVQTKPDEFMHVVYGNQIAVAVLRSEKEALSLLIEDHTKK